MSRNPQVALLLLAALCPYLVGCGTSPTDGVADYQSTLYVEGFLKAGSPVDSIYVGVTVPLYETYSRVEAGVPDASVVLEVDGTSSVLQPLPGRPGCYHLPTLQVESGKTYRLTVEAVEGTAHAETTVPYPPTITDASAEVTMGGDPFAATWEGSTAGGCHVREPEVTGLLFSGNQVCRQCPAGAHESTAGNPDNSSTD